MKGPKCESGYLSFFSVCCGDWAGISLLAEDVNGDVRFPVKCPQANCHEHLGTMLELHAVLRTVVCL